MDLPKTGKILELGSGNGDFWEKNYRSLNESVHLTVSDFSSGMVQLMQAKFKDSNVDVMEIDIQDIPFEDNAFDVIIANAMLYHVPNLEQALQEVNRILKPGGLFYASTFGESGLSEFIFDSLNNVGIKMKQNSNYTFTLQNGKTRLSSHFQEVKRMDYDDKLLVTNVQDLLDYIFSMSSMTDLNDEHMKALNDYFHDLLDRKGVIEISKEYGCFFGNK